VAVRPNALLSAPNLALAASLCLVSFAPACSEEPDSEMNDGGGTGDDDDDDDGTAGGEGGSGQVDGTMGGDGEPEVDVPARGITITKVEANPGVAIAIVENGQWVEGAQRNAQIPKGRNTAFRVYVDIDESVWVQREIEGRLTVIQSDGTEEVFSEIVDIGTDSSDASLQGNFLFGVLAEFMNPGASFKVELYEAGGDYQGLPAAETPPSAADGAQLIGIEGTEQNMKIMIVPVDYSFGGCTASFDTSEENLKKYEDAMFQQNALETIEMEVHPYITVNDLDLGDPGGFFQFLNRIVQLRASENPAPNVYYYGLFDNCGECIGDGGGCTLGVAPGTPGSSMGEAGSRAAIGVQYLSGSEVGIETFVHEVGHNQGRQHIACPDAAAAGPDVTYPYQDGSIGVWGFGVRDFSIRNPSNHKDYMSYCNPTWVSDWQWRATFERIRELSSWDAADMADAMDASRILVGAVNTETGESEWWTDRGWVEPGDTEEFARLRYVGDGASEEIEIDVDPWSEGPWVTVRAPLAMEMEFTTLELELPQRHIEISRDQVQMIVAP